MIRLIVLAVFLTNCLTTCGFVVAADGPAAAARGGKPVVAATVDDQPIFEAQVAELVAVVPRHDKLAARARARVEAEALSQLVDRRLVLHYLARTNQDASRHQIDAAISDLKSRLDQQKTSWEEYLKRRGLTEAAVLAELDWQMSWQRYVQQRITDKVLEKYFEDHRSEFDGTQVRVRHILLTPPDTLTPPGNANPQAYETLKQQATKIREEIISGQLTFAEAAEAYSRAPTGSRGGDLGFITRHGEMAEPFAAAAFSLQAQQVSSPVLTRHGVHLIQCTEIKPGERTWSDAVGPLRSAVTQQGFRRIASAERAHVRIAFTGRLPYLDPQTGRLVLPRPSGQRREGF